MDFQLELPQAGEGADSARGLWVRIGPYTIMIHGKTGEGAMVL